MSGHRNVIIRVAARLIPEAYRDEVVADLEADGRSLPLLILRIIRSAHDARRHMKEAHVERASWWSGIGVDFRSAWRQHRARPANAITVVVILAAAIGLNTALFSVVRGVLLRPLPFADEQQVVFLWNKGDVNGDRQPLAPARALDLGRQMDVVESSALIGHITMTAVRNGPPERWFGASVSASFFDVLKSPTAIGRTFHSGEPDRDVVVLSHRLWQQAWNGDPAVVGTTVMLNGRLRQIVGVMPADFYWPSITAESSAYEPPLLWACAPAGDAPEMPTSSTGNAAEDRGTDYVRLVARLRPGVTLAVAQAAADTTAANLGRDFPKTDGPFGVNVVGAREQLFGAVERPMLFVWLASAIVVFGACINVAALGLVRQAGRRREFAVRSALGAGRTRLIRQLVSESLVISIVGGGLGILAAAGGLRYLVGAAPESVGRLDQVALDGTVLATALLTSAVVGLLIGALSAATLWRDRSADDLRGAGSAEPGRPRLRRTLVAVESALAIVLLVGAALFGQSLVRLQRVDIGFNAANLLTFDVSASAETKRDPARRIVFFRSVLESLRALPGVTGAGAAVTLPIGGDDFGGRVYVQGRPLPSEAEDRRVGFQVVDTGWFDTLRVPILAGRGFTAADTGDTPPVIIVNEALAEVEWPGQSPIGQRVRTSREADAEVLTVVGVVGSVHHNGPVVAARPEFYRPHQQMPFSFMAIAVRTSGDPAALVSAARAAVAAVDSSVPIANVSTMAAHLDRTYGRARFLAALTSLFGLLALGLTIIGIYGVTNFTVTQRNREFGVRSALGATTGRLMRDVVGESLMPVVVGAAIGVSAAVFGGAAIRALLFGTAPVDPLAYVAAILILMGTATLGAILPARRAAAVDPVKALRDA